MAPPPTTLTGIVISSGKMMRAIKVRTPKQTYNRFLKKHFQTHLTHLVSDPTSAARTGDVVRIAAEGRVSRHIKHVVTEIVSPWGPGLEERPAVLTEVERVERRGSEEEEEGGEEGGWEGGERG